MFKISIKKHAVIIGINLCVAGLASAAAPLHHKSTTMQCVDRRITVEADCFANSSYVMCTRQSIRFYSVDGKPLGARVFQATPLKGADYPVVEEEFGELNCVETKEKQKYLIASMGNGGNCGQCEWDDIYSIDGTLIGSTRNRKKTNATLESATSALYDKKLKRVLNHQSFTNFYEDGSAR